ncbi:MAG TPA: HAMP domain-containing protein [Chloroflexi bacterium]|nr:HAMP domain-containing protein [Chloroflexota bacterium]
MSDKQLSRESMNWPHKLRRFFFSRIRNKIIIPYLVLTFAVAAIGIFIVTTLVAGSLEERLTNQLLEAGRAVSELLVRQERGHWEAARTVALTEGLAKALVEGDRVKVTMLAQRVASSRETECLMIVDAEGQEIFHTIMQEDGAYEPVWGEFKAQDMWIVRQLLEASDPDASPRRRIRQHPSDGRYYHFTAIPIPLEEGRMAGVIVVGTSLETSLPTFKTSSLADIIIYLDGGQAVASTFTLAEQPEKVEAVLERLNISPSAFEDALQSTEITRGEEIEIRGFDYRLARGSLQIGDEALGVFGVALPSSFIVQSSATSRLSYALVFTAGMGAVILIGYIISQRITSPLSSLVTTSQAVAEGDLGQRTGIKSEDEIGILADTFDEMTGRLSERTQALEEAIGRMRAILSSMGDGVMLEDLDGNLITLNTAAEELLNEMASNFMMGPLRDLSTDREQDGDEDTWLLDYRRFEVGNKTISVHSAPVLTDDGDELGTVIVMRDVTAEVEAERLKDAFITHVSHELRTPLTAIKGYTDLLIATTEDALQKEQVSFLETINRNTDDLMAMVSELLDFSEMEASGRLGILKRPTQMSTLIHEIIESWGPRIEDKDLVLQVEIADDLPTVAADTRRLHWAIVHLVRNAMQYTSPDGQVAIRLFQQDGYVVLEIEDTGVGISPKDQEHLFERFYRVTNMPDEDVRGLGVGLYLSNAIVEAHEGRMEVTSEPGTGSTFRIILPSTHGEHQDKPMFTSHNRE